MLLKVLKASKFYLGVLLRQLAEAHSFIQQGQLDTLQHSCSIVMRDATNHFNVALTWGMHSERLGIYQDFLAFHECLVEALPAQIKMATCDV